MLGIKFHIPNNWNNYLFQILKGIDSSDFIWQIGEEEVLGNHGESFFKKEFYDNQSFFQKIQERHYPIFVDIKLYNNNGNKNLDISNYLEFLQSDCLLNLFITDNIFVEIYCKDKELLDIIYKNVISNNFTDIELIDSENNVRKIFSPYYD